MNKFYSYIFAFALFFVFFATIGDCDETINPVAIFAKEEKDEKKLPKLLDLGAKKCIPCKKMAPILEELALKYSGLFDVEFIDVWQSENQKIAFKHGITSIPTQIFFDSNGNELFRHTGFMAKEDILNKWIELGFDFAKESN